MNLNSIEEKINKIITDEEISDLEIDQLISSILSKDVSEAEKTCLIDSKMLKNIESINSYAKKILQENINAAEQVTTQSSTEIIETHPDVAKTSSDPHIVLQAQSACRGYLSRELFLNETRISTQDINDLPTNLLSQQAKETFDKLGPYDFENTQLLGVTWRGPTKLSNGSIYFGECNNEGQPEGKGTMYCIDGGIREGNWKAEKLNGNGRWITPEGDVYVGNWVEGKKQGKGRMEWGMGKSAYEGNWVDDKPGGLGIESWSDGLRYEGNYRDGLKNGQGKFVWADGSFYEGGFVNGKIEGVGKYVWADGREYEGEWKSNETNGRGRYKWYDGRCYVGEFVNGQKQGYGRFEWPNGKRYEGFWLNDKQHGEGTLFNESGKPRKGIWENGKITN